MARRRAHQQAPIGRSIGTAFSVWRANFPAFFTLCLALFGPVALVRFVVLSSDGDLTSGEATVLQLLDLMESYVLPFLLSGCLAFTVFRFLSGGRATLGEAVSAGARALPRMMGLGLVMLLFFAIPIVLAVAAFFLSEVLGGFLVLGAFLVVVILQIVWFVAVPVAVVERLPIGQCLTRSGSLTAGNRWGIFWANILFTILIAVVSFLLGLIGGELLVDTDVEYWWSNVLATFVTFLFLGSLQGCFSGVVYFLLRQTKEGIQLTELANVFD